MVQSWIKLCRILVIVISFKFEEVSPETVAHVSPIASSSSIAVDASWDFEDGFEGWYSLSRDAMISHLGYSIGIDITGELPVIQSPNFNISIEKSVTIILRYRYTGSSSFGKFSLYGGKENDSDQIELFFPLTSGGQWHLTYAHDLSESQLFSLNGTLTSLQLYPGCERRPSPTNFESLPPSPGQGFELDWIRILRGPPVINRITGCSGNDGNSGSTYNCLRQGGEIITIEGLHFGLEGSRVTIDGLSCIDVQHDIISPQTKLTCITPSVEQEYPPNNYQSDSIVQVCHGKFPELVGLSTRLSFAYTLPRPLNVTVFNIASRSLDISWIQGGDLRQKSMCTGFVIRWRTIEEEKGLWTNAMIVGNVTNTTIRGLLPNTKIIIGIAALNENNQDASWRNLTDVYGRRFPLIGFLEGLMTHVYSTTLDYDFSFPYFNANLTLNHGSIDRTYQIGPTGIIGGEGHYGLYILQEASISNCNSSSFCCDSFDENNGRCNSGSTHVCVSHLNTAFALDDYSNEDSSRHLAISKLQNVNDEKLFTNRCGPSLMLTPSLSRTKGAFWYSRQMDVVEGFETSFIFELANPSQQCSHINGNYSNCKVRGASGFAFVIQNNSSKAIGEELGYDSISNSIAVEFDTFYDYEALDPYENHISVHTRGRLPNSVNHTFSIGETSSVPDLTNGKIRARIVYEPVLHQELLLKPSFTSSAYLQELLESQSEGCHPWRTTGLGLLKVYIQNMEDPALIVPLHLQATVETNRGRAWVGFTASTSVDHSQTHDILSWNFRSLRLDTDDLKSKFKLSKEIVMNTQT